MTDVKVCRSCEKEKTVAAFYKKGFLVSGAPRYRADCIECTISALDANPEERERVRLAAADWRSVDPDRGRKSCRDSRTKHRVARLSQQKADRLDAIKRPIILAQAMGSYRRHRTQRLADMRAWEAANAEDRDVYFKAYWKANPERAAEYQARRRARKAGAEGSHTAADIRAIRHRQGDKCANPACAIGLGGRGSVDHIEALVNGGSNWPVNLQLLCKPCDSRKRTRDNDEFLRCYALEKEAEFA